MRCVEDVTRRSSYGGSYTTSCDNPAEFLVRPWADWDGRPLGACRHHLPVLVKRTLTSVKRAPGIPVQVTLVIHEEES